MSDPLKTDIKGVVRSVSSVEELNALFAKIKANEPERYARLEAAGEYKNQLKVLGFVKEEKPNALGAAPKPKTVEELEVELKAAKAAAKAAKAAEEAGTNK